MGGRVSLSFLLVLLCASNGRTQNNNPPNPDTGGHQCKQREGTSLAVLLDAVLTYDSYTYYLEKILDSVLARFPCVTRQYTSVILDYAETNESITNDKREFIQSVTRSYQDNPSAYNYYNAHILNCNQSLLYGLKRTLEISPAESIILVYTSGSMVDCNDTRLLSEVYTLLKEKKSQVYFLWIIYKDCTIDAYQEDVFKEISSFSYGQFINVVDIDHYKLIHSFVLLMSKPLSPSVCLLDIHQDNTDQYIEVFDVPTSLSYILITRDEEVTLNFTDPNGNMFAFEKNRYPDFHTEHYQHKYNVLRCHLIKSPAAGSWILNVQEKSSFFVLIFGFTELDESGNCSDSDCHPNATCSEFGGYGECTCKEGFVGDGTTCNDIDECQDYDSNVCDYYFLYYYEFSHCVNTIGSYTCECNPGYKHKSGFDCVEIDECEDRSLNDCDPVAICTYYSLSYTCTCPDGYYGDGRHCEVNECQKGTPCGSNEDCIKSIGSYSCFEPCSNHTVLNDPWRSTCNTYNYSDYQYNWYHCDNTLYGWYRFKGEYDQQIPEYCVQENSCGTSSPFWMNGSHPTLSDGIVYHTACSIGYDGCCTQTYDISVKMCPKGFYVYKLHSTQWCDSAYCTESNRSCSGLDCAPDEERGIVDGVHGCYCRNSSNTTDGTQPGNLADYLTPQVNCGQEKIEVRFRKCLLEKLGYDTSSIHLIDNDCQGMIERSDKSYIILVTQPADGNCGGYILNNGTHITYTNTIYLTPQPDRVIMRDGYSINFSCSYPSNMEINRPTTAATT